MSLSVWDAALIADKTLTYAATLAAGGAVFFLWHSGLLAAGADRLRIRRMVLGLAVLGVAAGALQVPLAAGSLSSTAAGMFDGSLLDMVWQAGAGRANVIRAVGLALAALVLCTDRPAWPALLGAMLASTSFAWTGHASSLESVVLPLVLISLHLLGVAFWLGALVPLLLIVRSGDLARMAAAAARFGAVAVVVVCVLMLAGAALLWLLLGDFAALWSSTYGRYVMLKLGFVACLLSLAAFNKLRLTPRLLAADLGAVRSFRSSIQLELILGLLILAVTATFTSVTGPPALQ